MKSLETESERDSLSTSLSQEPPLYHVRRRYSKLRLILVLVSILFVGSYFRKHIRNEDSYTGNATAYPPYNEEEALQNALYAQVSFCTEEAITSWSCGDMCERSPIVGTDKVRFIPEGKRFQVHGYVAQVPTNSSDVKCVIGFRGSVNAANWYADFHLMLQPWPLNDLAGADWCPGCKAHTGFTEIYEELRPSVYRAIEELQCTRLVLTGHSLGAAVATIASFELRAAKNYHVDVDLWKTTDRQCRICNCF